MTREDMIALTLKCEFNDKQFDSMFYESGPYDISFPTPALESFYRAAFSAGQAEMRERAAQTGFSLASSDENACEIASSIRALECCVRHGAK